MATNLFFIISTLRNIQHNIKVMKQEKTDRVLFVESSKQLAIVFLNVHTFAEIGFRTLGPGKIVV